MLKIENFKNSLHNIREIEFTAGNVYAITGKNGSGKTTFVKYLAGYFEDYIGEIKYKNELQSTINNDISLILQNPFHQFVGQTVFDEVTYFLEQQNYDYKMINMKLKQITLPLNQELKTLSGGMAQRLLIETFMLGEKEIFIFDESFSNLDTISKQELFKKLRNLNKVVIYVTNNYYDLKYADWIYHFENQQLTISDFQEQECNLLENNNQECFSVITNGKTYQFNEGFNLITGKSGVGKTTFVEQIIGLQKSKIKLNSLKQLKFQYVSQYPFCQITTVTYQDIIKTEQLDIFKKLVNDFQLPNKIIEQEVVTLSTGELTQLLIIEKISSDANVIIFDESLEVLDYDKQQIVLKVLSKSKKTCIFITHNPEIYSGYPVMEVKL